VRLYEKTASELSEMLKNKECSAVELLNDINSRIGEKEPSVGAYVTLNAKAAETAEAVDRAIANGEDIHPLAGIPIGIKDNISTKGLATTCCSKMLENYVPPFNATVVDKINEANMVITGKMNMDEFAMGSSTETSYMHLTHNPHNLEYVPGGSSGGSAAAIASGEAILTLGSDTGGSIRQPASLCGIVGLKPTYGSVSRFGLIAFASSLDQIGPMGKSVKDVAMLQSLICGYDKSDATSKNIDLSRGDYASNLMPNVSGLRVGVPKEYFDDEMDGNVKQMVYIAIKEMEANGAVVRGISLPSTKHATTAYHIIGCSEASSNLARFDGVKYGYRTKEYSNFAELFEKSRGEAFGDEVKFRIMLGIYSLSTGNYEKYFKKAMLVRKMISAELHEALSECDVLVTPTTPSAAFKIGECNDVTDNYYCNRYVVPVNLAGLPAISVPCGKDDSGLPFGMQLIGGKFCEQTLLNTAFAYEQFVGGFK